MNMVALLRPQPEITAQPRQLRLVVTNGHVVDGERALRSRWSTPAGPKLMGVERMVVVAVVIGALVVFGGLTLIRSFQGGATAESWAGVDAAASGSAVGTGVGAAPGDLLYVARPGDSMWSIAQVLAPDSDPRPVVAALIEANGVDSLQIGQQIVIPEQLLD